MGCAGGCGGSGARAAVFGLIFLLGLPLTVPSEGTRVVGDERSPIFVKLWSILPDGTFLAKGASGLPETAEDPPNASRWAESLCANPGDAGWQGITAAAALEAAQALRGIARSSSPSARVPAVAAGYAFRGATHVLRAGQQSGVEADAVLGAASVLDDAGHALPALAILRAYVNAVCRSGSSGRCVLHERAIEAWGELVLASQRACLSWETHTTDVAALGGLVEADARGGHSFLSPWEALMAPLAHVQTVLVANQVAARLAPAGARPAPGAPVGVREGRVVVAVLSNDFSQWGLHGLAADAFPMPGEAARVRFVFLAWGAAPRAERLMRGVAAANLVRLPAGASAADAAREVNAAGAGVVMDMLGWLPVGRAKATLEAVALLRPALLAVHAHGWYGSTGGAVALVLADRVVWPPETRGLAAPAPLLDAPLLVPPPVQHNALRRLFPALPRLSPEPPPAPPPRDAARARLLRAAGHRVGAAGGDAAGAGAGDAPPVLCAMHESFKLSPALWRALMDVLRAEPRALLIVPARTFAQHVIPSLKREAQRLGVNPVRVLPLPRADDRASYLALLQGCDALADAREFNAHTTAADALYAGVPVVTLPGAAARWVGRVGASLAEGLPTGVVVARSWQDYQRTLRAVLRARDRAARRLARALHDAPLFSGAAAWRARLAAALALAFDAHCSGAAPRSAVALAEGWPAP